MAIRIVYLDAATMGAASTEEVSCLGEYTAYPSSTPEQARLRVAECEVLIINKLQVDEDLMNCAKNLKLICVAATGMNNVDLGAAKRKGIIVRNVAGYSTDSVAQSTFTHLLRLVSNGNFHDEYVKSGSYSASGLFTEGLHPAMELAGKTMGIIGMGTIGSRVAQIALAFGMKVVYYSTSGTSHCTDYPSLSLEELLKTADVVSIHAPLNEHTRSLIGREELTMMKSSAYLLNVGRGSIVDEVALAQAVDEGWIAGAGLDVFETEPLPSSSPLLKVAHPERFSFTPHTAWASIEARARLIHKIAENIRLGW